MKLKMLITNCVLANKKWAFDGKKREFSFFRKNKNIFALAAKLIPFILQLILLSFFSRSVLLCSTLVNHLPFHFYMNFFPLQNTQTVAGAIHSSFLVRCHGCNNVHNLRCASCKIQTSAARERAKKCQQFSVSGPEKKLY